jgi:catecholate siderophore receptor
VPFADPDVRTPVTFRQSATDADNRILTLAGATYVQDQMAISARFLVIAGLRVDHFDLRYHNNRTADELRRIDNVASPRAGVVFKPITSLSFYGTYSISFLPSSGDQFSSLTTVTQQVKPEKFSNYETGVKWDAARRLSLTAAIYRLDRTNTRSTDPNDPTRIVQTGSQRTNGAEIGWNGNVTRRWRIAGGYAWQDAYVSAATASAKAGARVAQVPRWTFSLWNHYQIRPRLAAGLGLVSRTAMFAAIDDTVELPGYVRVDGAVFYSLTERLRVQANVENLGNRRYTLNADGNNNISPGSPRAVRIGMVARF